MGKLFVQCDECLLSYCGNTWQAPDEGGKNILTIARIHQKNVPLHFGSVRDL